MDAITKPSTRFTPTREAGLARLRAFLPRAGREYAETRNFVRPPGHDNVSGLSPWIRCRLLTEEEVADAALCEHGFAAAEKFVQEIYWRTYWKGWLEQRPEVWRRWRDGLRGTHEGLDKGAIARWQSACEGRTGIDGFDAWAHELVETGWMHNHARMWFASIWIFTLRLPWELGAEFFHTHLLDGDPASNLLSWRWVAGLQTTGKTYLARADNIARYTDGAHRPDESTLAAEPVLQVESLPPQVPLAERAEDHPAALRALAEAGRAGLWVTGDDLAGWPEAAVASGWVAGWAGWPARIAASEGWSAKVEAWMRGAMVDATTRLARAGGPVFARPDLALPVEGLVEWARAERLDLVVAVEPTVGPWRDAFAGVEPALAVAGVRLVWIRRREDARRWPLARRGYFPFWERMKVEAAARADSRR